MKKFAGLLCALLIPLMFQFQLKKQNTAYPQNDSGFYFVITQLLHDNFQNENFTDAIQDLYVTKHWKPILHPVLAVPVLFLTGGDVRLAAIIYTTLLYLILVSLVYLYFRRHLRLLAAVVGTLLIAFLPWVIGVSTCFNSELTFMAGTLGFFYVSETENDFHDSKKALSAGLWMSLIMCLRPVETLLIFSFPVLAFVTRSYARKVISVRDLFTLVPWFALATFMLVPPHYYIGREWRGFELFLIFVAASLLFAGLIIWCKKLRLNKSFQIFFGLTGFTTIVWYAPGARTLIDWIFVANFDTLAIETGNRFGKPLVDFLNFYFDKLGYIPVVLLFISFLNMQMAAKKIFNLNTLISFIGIIFIPVIAGAVTYNGDVRYYYGGWLLLCAVLTKNALLNDDLFYKLRLGLISGISVLLIYNAYLLSVYNMPRNSAFDKLGGAFFTLLPEVKESRGLELKISEHIENPNGRRQNVILVINEPVDYIDPFEITLIANERGVNREYQWLNLFDKWERKTILGYDFEYFMVGPVDSIWNKYATDVNQLAIDFSSVCHHQKQLGDFQDLAHFRFISEIFLNSNKSRIDRFCLFKKEK